MTDSNQILDDHTNSEYKWGFVSDLEQEFAKKGLNEDIVKFISAKKNEPQWLLDWRL
jgi:Fe-S cluster assembly protein SufB